MKRWYLQFILVFVSQFYGYDFPAVPGVKIVKECPSPQAWEETERRVCSASPGLAYHCLYTVNCTSLVEFCRKPEDTGAFLLYYVEKYTPSETNLTLRIVSFDNLPSNSSKYNIVQKAFCKNSSQVQQLNSNDCPGVYLPWVLFGIACFIIVILVFVLIFKERIYNYCQRNTHDTASDNTKTTERFITQPTEDVSRTVTTK